MILEFIGNAPRTSYIRIGVNGNNLVDDLVFIIGRKQGKNDLYEFTPKIKITTTERDFAEYSGDDITVKKIEERDTIEITYVLPEIVTERGNVDMLVVFEKSIDGGKVKKWQTLPFNVTFPDGIDESDSLIKAYPNIVRELKVDTEKAVDDSAAAVSTANAAKSTADAAKTASDNAVATANEAKFAVKEIGKALADTQAACELASGLESKVSRNSKEIANLQAALNTDLFVTNDTTAYKKDVPVNALPYASIDKIGGALASDLSPVKVTKIVSEGVNRIDEKGISKITISKTGQKRYGWIIPVEEAGTYTLSVYGEYDIYTMAIAYKILRANGAYSSFENLTNSTKRRTIEAKAGDTILVYLADGYTKLQPNQILQLNKGAYMQYQPYEVLDTFQIPAEVQAIKGYGEANPDDPTEANYIDLEARKFVAYGYMDEGDWVAYGTPVETDISAYLSVDNFIRVGGAGTLTFVNENGIAVPSAVTYQLEVIQ